MQVSLGTCKLDEGHEQTPSKATGGGFVKHGRWEEVSV